MGLLSMFKTYSLKVTSIEKLDHDFYAVNFSKPQNLSWEAGAYARFLLPESDAPNQKERWLTIASLPDKNCITVITWAGENSSVYKKQLVSMKMGTQVDMKGLSSFKDSKIDSSPLVCFASNIGISAIRPAVKELKNTTVPIHVFFLNDGCHAFEREIEQLAGENPQIRFEQVLDMHTLLESANSLSQDYNNTACYCLAGGTESVQNIEHQLLVNGISAKQIKKEIFRGI